MPKDFREVVQPVQRSVNHDENSRSPLVVIDNAINASGCAAQNVKHQQQHDDANPGDREGGLRMGMGRLLNSPQ